MIIPAELFGYKQWVLWKRFLIEGRTTKVPISPWSGKKAACDHPQTWSSYKHARYVQNRWACDGIGSCLPHTIRIVALISTNAGTLPVCSRPRQPIFSRG
jgi:primase-polymerase (primpol)-like protein